MVSMKITIYDKKGKTCAYIATDDTNTIYLFNGKPVAYIDDENIYAFNGKHLGWFKRKRVMYDREGLRIGFTSICCPSNFNPSINLVTKRNAFILLNRCRCF